jgi:putative transposase
LLRLLGMSRYRTVLQSDFPYNIGARCINRDWFKIPLPEVWEIMSEQLSFMHHAFEVEILAFVLMSNHFHLIATTPHANIDVAMAWFMRESSRTLVRAGNRINQTYGGPYFRSILKCHHYYLNAYKYLYYNPVHAGACCLVEEYPYSTLPGLLGSRRLTIPVEDDLTLFNDPEGTLEWLNRKPDEQNWQAVRKATRRREFQFGRCSNRRHKLEIDTL